jgi:hypothetical protein
MSKTVLIYLHIDQRYIYENINKEKGFFWPKNENTDTC